MKYDSYIFIEKNHEDIPIITIFDGKIKHQSKCSLSVDPTNNNLKITNICNITPLETGMIFHKINCQKTENYFGDFMIDIIGNELMTMSTDGLFFASIYKTGSNINIPSSGIGVDEDIFNILKSIINDDISIEVKNIDNFISDTIPNKKEIPKLKGFGIKHCKCQNKKASD